MTESKWGNIDKATAKTAAQDETAFTQAGLDTQPDNKELLDLESIGEFTNLKLIGRGGMGVVYRALHPRLKRYVAIKMLATRHASAEETERFRREAEAAAQFEHVGIVPVHEIGEEDDRPYFVMGLVDGESLAEKLRENPLPPERAAKIVRDVAKAIDYAHGRGIIHRDLKPGNILIDAEGVPKVSDFGIARRLEVDQELTATGEVLGTPGYMPPEQASGVVKNIGPTSDVYSLGAVLYHALTGRPPFAGQSATETLMNVLLNDPVPPRKLNPRIPRDLETICLKCLEKQPKRRYAKAIDVYNDLNNYLSREPISARPISAFGKLGRWMKRQPIAAGLSLLLILAVVIGVTAVTIQWKRAEDNSKEATKLAKVADDEKGKAIKAADAATKSQRQAEAREKEVSELLYEAYLRLATDAQRAGNYLLAAKYLDRVIPKEGERDLRTLAWFYLDRNRRIRNQMKLPTPPEYARDRRAPVAVSPNGKYVAIPDLESIRIYNEDGELFQTVRLPNAVKQIAAITFSPSSDYLAFSGARNPKRGDTEHRLWNLKENQYSQTLTTKTRFWPAMLKFSPNGRRLLGVSLEPGYVIWDVLRGQPLAGGNYSAAPRNYKRVAISLKPDGKSELITVPVRKTDFSGSQVAAKFENAGPPTLVFISDYEAWRWKIGVPQPQRILGNTLPRKIIDNRRPPTGVGVSDDGTRVAVQGTDGVEIWDTQLLKLDKKLSGLERAGGVSGALAFSPDGKKLVGIDRDLQNDLLIWRLGDGTFAGKIAGLDGRPTLLRFSEEGLVVATSTGQITTWQVADEGVFDTWTRLKGNDIYRVFDEGTRVIATGVDPKDPKKLQVWNARNGGSFGEGPLPLSVRSAKVWNSRRLGNYYLSWDGRATVFTQPVSEKIVDDSPQDPRTVLSLVAKKTLLTLPKKKDHQYINPALSDDSSILSVIVVPKVYPKDLPETERYKHSVYEFWDVQTQKKLTTFQPPTATTGVCTSPRGKRIAIGFKNGEVRIWNRKEDTWTTLKQGDSSTRPYAISREGSYLACVSGRLKNQVRIWNLKTGRVQAEMSLGRAGTVSLEFSPDGRSLLALKGINQFVELVLIDPRTGQARTEIRIPPKTVGDMRWFATFNHTGDQIFVPLKDGRIIVLGKESR